MATNAFYNPSGNPTTGSEGLSAVIRAEFASIAAGFSLLPRLSTTGLYDTIFAQQGSYTLTLPAAAGTLALTTDVAAAVTTETNRATAAEGTLTTAVSTEATTRAAAVTAETNRATAAEGTLTTAVSTEATTRAAAVTAETNRATAAEGTLTTAVNTKAQTGTAASFTSVTTTAGGGVAADGAVYAGRTATSYGFYMFGDGGSRVINWSADGWKFLWNASTGSLSQFTNGGTGIFNVDAGGNLMVPGTVTASNVSDERTKRNIEPYRTGLAGIIGLEPITYEYNGAGGTTDNGKKRWGVTAQQASLHLPECVYATPEPNHDPTHPDPDKLRIEGQLSFDEQPLLYAMVNAFRDVADQLQAVQARLQLLELRGGA